MGGTAWDILASKGELLNIDDYVAYKDGSYNSAKMRVAGIAGSRIQIARIDSVGREWRRYEDAKDLVVVK